jgi:hypothetical protein
MLCSELNLAILATGTMVSNTLIVTLSFLLSFTGSAQAAEWDHAGVAGMAGAGTANPYDNSGTFKAPATAALVPLYTTQVDLGLNNTLAEGWWGTTTVRDSQSGYTSAVLSYTRTDSNPTPLLQDLPGWITPGETLDNATTEHDLRLSLGYGLAARRLSVAASGVYQRRLSDLGGKNNLYELDLSIAGIPFEGLVLAATVHDVLPGAAGRPITGEVGAWWRPVDTLSFALDGLYTEQGLGFRGGLEWVTLGVASLRAGYAHTFGENREGLVGLGVGAVSDQARLDYGLQWVVLGDAKNHLVHTLGTTVAF